jgi:RNA polymerase sigma-70 factor (ECF subfamily)
MSTEKSVVPSDDVELAKWARRDAQAAEKILKRLYPKIFKVVRSVVRNHHQADDVGQTAAVEVMKSLQNYKGRGTLEAWAGQIAFRVAVRSMKSAEIWDQKHVPIWSENLEDTANPEKTAIRRQLFESLIGKIDAVSGERKVPLLLHLAYGYTVEEVSELTGVSPNTIKDRLKIAYHELREVMKNNPGLRRSMLEEIP